MSDNSEKLPSFEKALAELEALVVKLETGDTPLDESLADFKKGVELTRECQAALDKAQQSVEKLLNPDDEDSAEPFDADD